MTTTRITKEVLERRLEIARRDIADLQTRLDRATTANERSTELLAQQLREVLAGLVGDYDVEDLNYISDAIGSKLGMSLRNTWAVTFTVEFDRATEPSDLDVREWLIDAWQRDTPCQVPDEAEMDITSVHITRKGGA